MKRSRPLPRPTKPIRRGDPPARSTEPLTRSSIKRKPPKPRPPEDVDEAYIAWLHTIDCRVAVYMRTHQGCMGPMEAHHGGQHGLSQRAPDHTAYSLCNGHHHERHELRGFFAPISKADRRAWEDEQAAVCRAMYAEDGGKL